jgi:predicted phage-related endonuclease
MSEPVNEIPGQASGDAHGIIAGTTAAGQRSSDAHTPVAGGGFSSQIERRPITSRAAWLEWRTHDVTASDIACLFGDGIHPYRSAFELWAFKSGRVQESALDTPAMRRGQDLEHVVLDMLRRDYPSWTIIPGAHYYRDPAARIGATPDAFVTCPDVEGLGVLQVKTAGDYAFRRTWRADDGEIETPLWIAIQATVEASLTGAAWAAVAVLEMAAWQVHLEEIPLNPALMEKLRELVADFWRRVAEDDAYPPNYAHDAAMIARLYAEAEDAEINLAADNRIVQLIAEREKLKAWEADGDAAEKARKIIDAEIIAKLGAAERGRLADGRLIVAPTRRRAAHEVKASTWRQISVKAATQ